MTCWPLWFSNWILEEIIDNVNRTLLYDSPWKKVFIVSRFLEGNNTSFFTGHGSIMTCSHNNLKLLPMYWSRYFCLVKPPWFLNFSSDLWRPLGTCVQMLFLLNTILLVLFEFMSVIYALLLWTILFKSKTLTFTIHAVLCNRALCVWTIKSAPIPAKQRDGCETKRRTS